MPRFITVDETLIAMLLKQRNNHKGGRRMLNGSKNDFTGRKGDGVGRGFFKFMFNDYLKKSNIIAIVCYSCTPLLKKLKVKKKQKTSIFEYEENALLHQDNADYLWVIVMVKISESKLELVNHHIHEI